MLEHLFGSKARVKVLKAFMKDSEKSFYVRELTRMLDLQINAVRRELETLENIELIKEVDSDEVKRKEEKAGSSLRKYFKLNKEAILYPELQSLILKAQVLGEQKFVNEMRKKAGIIKLFLLTGQFSGDSRAPSDLLLVGKLKERSISRVISKYEKDFGFTIKYTTMTEQEFYDRRHVMDKFLYALFEAENVMVVDEIMA
ncbi:MAG: hypothetical protein GF349_03830 [Candidatus Magasanikbacteria bacterium]|nr:hypothetical protein [Candidatus Magasanikbacteria bacterium]